MPAWKIDSDELHHEELCVRLGFYARNLEQATAYVGLASIANDETAYVFATDTARVELDTETGEVLLWVHLALLGEWSFLGRVGYQVVATVVRVNARITGKITWAKRLFTPPSDDVSHVGPHLIVTANKHEVIPPDPMAPFGGTRLTPVAPGQVIGVDIRENDCVAQYRVDNPPMALPLQVTLQLGSAFHTTGANVVAGQITGPLVFTLAAAAPAADNIDFAITTLHIA